MKTGAQESAYRTEPVLYMAIELAEKKWKVAFGVGLGDPPRVITQPAGDRSRLKREIEAARKRLGLPAGCRVRSCYEAGRQGFWVHRWLVSEGVDNTVVDPSSLQAPRRKRRAKTDRLDAESLLRSLLQVSLGVQRLWREVRIPTPEEEHARYLHREIETLKKERTSHRARMRSLLALYGATLEGERDFVRRVLDARQWNGEPLPAAVRDRLEREGERLRTVERQKRELETIRRERLAACEKASRLLQLRGIGETGAWLLVRECFGWRPYRNRKQAGSWVGLTGTPFNSGESSWEQGISKAGNRRVRALMIELSWLWLKHQPQSALSRWHRSRWQATAKRHRRVGIVAVARRLFIDLWRYAEFGVLPDGAQLKVA
jgi:transposase